MFYIHQHTCISPQQTFKDIDIASLKTSADNKLKVVEGPMEGIPPALLRRMGKAVRIGVGAGLPIVKQDVDGIIIGTANGGMEDCIKFLNQVIEYKEGMLTPGSFVQSTNNAVAGQLGLMSANTGYNVTHVHRAWAFENVLTDADMLLAEQPASGYLAGAVDEISVYNYNIEFLAGGYKREPVTNTALYESSTEGSIAGEGAAMFLVNKSEAGAVATFRGVHMFRAQDDAAFEANLHQFLARHLEAGEKIDLLLSGENGDSRLLESYRTMERLMDTDTTIARFKHMCGEYPTAVSFAVWLACRALQTGELPAHAIYKGAVDQPARTVLIYNNYKGCQQSLVLLSR